jgi:hypothetical protein
MPTIQPNSTLTKQQKQMWDILTDNYADQAHMMLDDMYENGKIDYCKADKHFEYIMDNWPDMEVFRATKTWLTICPLDTRKLNTFSRFIEIYADIILKNKKQYVLYQKHNLSPITLTKTK